MSTNGFYDSLLKQTAFSDLTDDGAYIAVPDNWYIGVSDVVNSTGEVAAGRYKTVNMVGAAVISAVMNGHKGRAFPFVFGGDGASFAIDPEQLETTRRAMAAVATWADTEFGIGLRVALIPVSAVRAAGYDVKVARFRVSDGADYAMFTGGGVLWAEEQMKDGRFCLAPAPVNTQPDLTGLSCRWANMSATQGTILSLVVSPLPNAARGDIARVYRDVIALAEGLKRGGHPAPASGMVARRAPMSSTLEAHASRNNAPLAGRRRKVFLEVLIYWLLNKTGLTVGGFDARHYARAVAANADFRKLDDGLKMTLDCDAQTHRKLEAVLAKAAAAGLVRYGISSQQEAMMTCIVPSIMTDDHLHFIDGAGGGYTQAASQMKKS